MDIHWSNKESIEKDLGEEEGARDIIGLEMNFVVGLETDYEKNLSMGLLIDEVFKVIESSEFFDDYDDIEFTLSYNGISFGGKDDEILQMNFDVTINDLPN